MKLIIQTAIFSLLLSTGSAIASIVKFDCAETNGSFTIDCGIGESQLQTTVTDNGSGATFRFQNLGVFDSIISNIYFDDTASSLMDFSTVAIDDAANGPLNNIGVDFTDADGNAVAAIPGDLPGAVPFDVSFATGRDNRGGIGRGINNASSEPMLSMEILDISVGYSAGSNIDLLLVALDSGAFQIGLKVQAFADGGSEWFTSTTTTSVVPVPAAFWLFGTALIGFIGISRRTRI